MYKPEYSYWLTVTGEPDTVKAAAKDLAELKADNLSCFHYLEMADQEAISDGNTCLSYAVMDELGTISECTDDLLGEVQEVAEHYPELRFELFANNEEDHAEGTYYLLHDGETYESHRRAVDADERWDKETLEEVLNRLVEAGDTTGEAVVRDMLANYRIGCS